MELLYFICGILSVGITYAVVLLKKNQSNYHDALARLQHHQNISSIRNAEVNERLDEMMEVVRVIQSDYVPNGDLSERIKNIDNILEEMAKKIAKDRSFTEKVQFDAGNNIQRLNDRINKIGQDPGLQSNY